MDNEKNNIDLEQEVSEATEEITEVVEETVEETVEEAVEEISEEAAEEIPAEPEKKVLTKVYLCDSCNKICEDAYCDVCDKELTDAYICTPEEKIIASKKRNKNILVTVCAVVAVVVLAFVGKFVYFEVYNPYNSAKGNEYLCYGDTLEDLAKEAGYDYKTFLELNNLPSSMPKSTYVNVAGLYIPVKGMAERYGVSVQEYIENSGIEGEFSDDVTMGEVQDELSIETYFGLFDDGALADLKKEYGLDDSVTMDTKFKEIKEKVYKHNYDEYMKEQSGDKEEIEDVPEVEDVETEADVEADATVTDEAAE